MSWINQANDRYHVFSFCYIYRKSMPMKKILVIEDTFEVRDNLEEILELSGYEVYTAENGKIGVKKALEVHPDLILCDVMMPELDGFGVVRILSAKPETADIPFIFLTAKSEKSDFRKGMNLGADDYITKPFDDVELLDAIEMRLKKSEKIRTSFDGTPQGLNTFINEAKGDLELKELSEGREIRKFPKKSEIYTEGSMPRYLYFIHSGKIKVHRINEWGKELITSIFRGGEFMGYESLIKGVPYSDAASALEEVEVSLIPKDDFLSLLYGSREFSSHFIKMLADNVYSQEEKLIRLAYDSIRKRVADALIQLNERFEEKGISIMRDDLAALVGTAKETAIRTLSEFKEDNYIRIEKGKITIQDLEALKDMPG